MSQRNIAFEFVEKELLGHRQSLSRHHESFLERVSSFQDERSANERKIQMIQSQIETLTKEIEGLQHTNRAWDVEIEYERETYEQKSADLKTRVACLEAVQSEMDKAVQAEMDHVSREEKEGAEKEAVEKEVVEKEAVEKEVAMKQKDMNMDLFVLEGTMCDRAGNTENVASLREDPSRSYLATFPASTTPHTISKSPSTEHAAQIVAAISAKRQQDSVSPSASSEPDLTERSKRRRSSHVTSIDYARLQNVTKRAKRGLKEKPVGKAEEAGGRKKNQADHVTRDTNSAEITREAETLPEAIVSLSNESTESEQPAKKKAKVNCGGFGGSQSDNDNSLGQKSDAESGKERNAEAVNCAVSGGKTEISRNTSDSGKTIETSCVSDIDKERSDGESFHSKEGEDGLILRALDAAHVTKKRRRRPKKGAGVIGEIARLVDHGHVTQESEEDNHVIPESQKGDMAVEKEKDGNNPSHDSKVWRLS